jgi:hypothetical protein
MRSSTRLAIAAALPWAAFAFQADFNWSGTVSPGQTLAVKSVNGAIHAELAAGNTIEVSARKTAQHSDPNSVEIRVVPSSAGVTICAVYPNDSGLSNDCNNSNTRNNDVVVDFTVKVPAGVHFEPSTVNGSVHAKGLKSDVDAASVNGSIHVETSGLTRASTVNGSIEATMGASSWDGALSFSSVNGSIDLTMPAAVNADVHATSVSGSISSDFPLTMNGAISKGNVRAKIGAGGPELKFSTVNGAVRLHQGTV